jgi:hypothetical protein
MLARARLKSILAGKKLNNWAHTEKLKQVKINHLHMVIYEFIDETLLCKNIAKS